MSYHFLLPLLMYADFGGKPSYGFKTKNCVASRSNCNLTRFNRAYHNGKLFDQEIEAIKTYFGRVPFTWIVEANDFDSENMLKNHGFSKYLHLFSGMKVGIKNIAEEIYAPYIGIKQIDQKEDIEKLIDIVSVSFSIEDRDELKKGIYSLLERGPEAVKLYLASYRDVPCAASIIIYHDDIATLHMIGTLPEYRSRGLGYAVTHKPLIDAMHKGIKEAVLMASFMGQSLYKKIGFEEYVQYYVHVYRQDEVYKI